MNMFLEIICVLLAVSAFLISLIKFLHFFQLNSYRASTHTKWLRENTSKYIPNLVFGIIALCFSGISGIGANLVFASSMLLGALTSKPGRAKKPLVYTMRVKRLIITAFVIYSIMYVLFMKTWGALAFIVSPAYVMLANFINRPIEKAISNYYINDAKKLLSSSNAKVIGITGSYGKTSVKYYLTTLLKAKYNVLMTPESYNTPMGVVKTIRSSLSALHEIFVCEMGAKRVGEIKEICDIVHPDMGIITSVGPQHLETFKSIDNVKKTKFELADALPDGGMLFLNGNDDNISEHKGSRSHISYSVNGDGTYNATGLSLSDKGTEFTVTSPDGENCRFSTKLIGTHNVLNITGAIAVVHSMGISLSSLRAQVSKLEAVPHRLELVRRGNDIIIDDAFNSNPKGTKAALETLSQFDGCKIIITPGMVELGAEQDRLNSEFGEDISKVCDKAILVGKSQTESIYKGLKSQNYPGDKIYIASDFTDAIAYAYGLNTQGERKVILLENDLPDNY